MFLGWRIQRHRKRGTSRSYVYTYPARKAVKAVTGKVKTMCRQISTNQPLEVLLLRLNQMLRGWCAYFRPGVSSATFAYLSAYTWARVIGLAAPQTPPEHREGHSVAATAGADGGRPRRNGRCSTRPRCAPRATDTGVQRSRLRGRSRDEEPHDPERDLWSARCPETGTAGAGGGSGKPTGGNTGRAPRVDAQPVSSLHADCRAGAWGSGGEWEAADRAIGADDECWIT